MAYHGLYRTPKDLLQDESLARDEKIEMLESWKDDKEAYMRASDEGMGGNGGADLLREIERALLTLKSDTGNC